MTLAEYRQAQQDIAEIKAQIAQLRTMISQGTSAIRDIYGLDQPKREASPDTASQSVSQPEIESEPTVNTGMLDYGQRKVMDLLGSFKKAVMPTSTIMEEVRGNPQEQGALENIGRGAAALAIGGAGMLPMTVEQSVAGGLERGNPVAPLTDMATAIGQTYQRQITGEAGGMERGEAWKKMPVEEVFNLAVPIMPLAAARAKLKSIGKKPTEAMPKTAEEVVAKAAPVKPIPEAEPTPEVIRQAVSPEQSIPESVPKTPEPRVSVSEVVRKPIKTETQRLNTGSDREGFRRLAEAERKQRAGKISTEEWARGIQSIDVLGRNSKAVSTPVVPKKSLAEANRILNPKPNSVPITPDVTAYIGTLRKPEKISYAKAYYKFVKGGSVGDSPQYSGSTMGGQAIRMRIDELVEQSPQRAGKISTEPPNPVGNKMTPRGKPTTQMTPVELLEFYQSNKDDIGGTFIEFLDRVRAEKDYEIGKLKRNEVTADYSVSSTQDAGATPAQSNKQPWEMTREEYAGKRLKLKETGNTVSISAMSDERLLEFSYRTSSGKKITQGFTDAGEGREIALNITHKADVESALSEGKPVPASVLADYPDLAAKYGKGGETPKVAETVTQKAEAHAEAVYDKGFNKTFREDMTANLDKAISDWKAMFEKSEGVPFTDAHREFVKTWNAEQWGAPRKLTFRIGNGEYTVDNTLNTLEQFKKSLRGLSGTPEPKNVPLWLKKARAKEPTNIYAGESPFKFGKDISDKLFTKGQYQSAIDDLKSAKADYRKLFKVSQDLKAKHITLKKAMEMTGTKSRYQFEQEVSLAADRLSKAGKEVASYKSAIENIQSGNPPPAERIKFGQGGTVELGAFGTPSAVIDLGKTIKSATDNALSKVGIRSKLSEATKSGTDAMLEHHRNLRESEFEVGEMVKEFDKIKIPTDQQEIMVHALEQPDKYLQQLDPAYRQIFDDLRQARDRIGQYAVDEGLIDAERLKDEIGYVFHHWIDKKTGEAYAPFYGKFSKTAPQLKERKIPTYEAGIAAGMKPASMNPADLIGKSIISVTRAANARRVLKSLAELESPSGKEIIAVKNPRPLRMIESWDKLRDEGLTDGYVRYDHPALDKPIVIKSGDATVIMKGSVGIDKELFPFVKAYMESPTYGKLSRLNFATKSLKLMSGFHVIALNFQATAGSPGLSRIPVMNVVKGLKQIKAGGENMKLLYRNGLEIKGYADVGVKNALESNKLTRNTLGLVQRFTFDVVHPGIKANTAMTILEDLLSKEQAKLGRALTVAEKDKIASETVRYADRLFSGEDYKGAMLQSSQWMAKFWYSPAARKRWQTWLLSPTWQKEHIGMVHDIVKSLATKEGRKSPTAKYVRRYFYGALSIYGAANLYNWAMTKHMDGEGRFMWQNDGHNSFSVRAPWNDEDGRKAYFRPLKSIFEIPELLLDPIGKAINKLAPWVQGGASQVNPSDFRKYEGYTGTGERIKDIAQEVGVPMAGTTMTDPSKPIASKVLSFVGVPTSKGYTLSQLKDQRTKAALRGDKTEVERIGAEIKRLMSEGKEFMLENKREATLKRIEKKRKEYEKLRGQ